MAISKVCSRPSTTHSLSPLPCSAWKYSADPKCRVSPDSKLSCCLKPFLPLGFSSRIRHGSLSDIKVLSVRHCASVTVCEQEETAEQKGYKQLNPCSSFWVIVILVQREKHKVIERTCLERKLNLMAPVGWLGFVVLPCYWRVGPDKLHVRLVLQTHWLVLATMALIGSIAET